jgi:glycolate oxidase FAD binding subunit
MAPAESKAEQLVAGSLGSIFDAVGYALPHALEAQCGAWRDWVLGMTLALADGTVATCGSHAVKNVAGYDVQRFLVGSRGWLAIPLEVILRTMPMGAVPASEVTWGPAGGLDLDGVWIQRTLRSDFSAAVGANADRFVAADPASSTLWVSGPPARRFEHDWVLGKAELSLGEDERRFLLQAKSVFDPRGKLSPGAFGI